MRGRMIKPQIFVAVQMKTYSPAISIFTGRWNDRAKLEITQFADPAQRIFDALPLCLELRLIAYVLPRAAAAFAAVRTRRLLPHGRRAHQTKRLSDGISLL